MHAKPHGILLCWLGTYQAFTPGTDFGDNTTVRLDNDNEPQPDALLRILPERGGQTSDSEDDYLVGAPEFIAEVAASSASYDRNSKMQAYQRNGVREYLLWLMEENAVEWWGLVRGEYRLLEPDASSGLLCSKVFPGLWLDPEALRQRNTARVLEVVREGVESAEHAEFVKTLTAAAEP
jgi:Uma2 family endonuclease